MNITHYFAKDLFQGKTVFITGGSSGINLGIARNFAAVGANLGIVGRAQEKLDAAAAELRALGARVSAHSADVRDYRRWKVRMHVVSGGTGTDPCPGMRRRAAISPSPPNRSAPTASSRWSTSICWAASTPAGRRSSNSETQRQRHLHFGGIRRSCPMPFKCTSARPRPASTT
ncbi:MAG: SDR family NAD(P)-dependent oxidoreductase [Chromatiales bacterium]|nr:SDR family NAD(P)-dependent oxidoreductase [Chromatiales bacterium]